MSRVLQLTAALAALLLFFLVPASAAQMTIVGDVTYRERVALPPGATLSVALVDLANPGTPGLVATADLASQGGVPLRFTLSFDDASIVNGHEYGLVAKIGDQSGTIWFHNPEPFSIDPKAPPAQILIVVSPSGSIAQGQPSTEQSALLNVTWHAESIGGKGVAPGSVSSLSIDDDLRAGGRGGCNSWFAQAKLQGDRLAFTPLAATRIACTSETLTAQEGTFFSALAATKRWQVREGRLRLFDGQGGELVVLVESRF